MYEYIVPRLIFAAMLLFGVPAIMTWVEFDGDKASPHETVRKNALSTAKKEYFYLLTRISLPLGIMMLVCMILDIVFIVK